MHGFYCLKQEKMLRFVDDKLRTDIKNMMQVAPLLP